MFTDSSKGQIIAVYEIRTLYDINFRLTLSSPLKSVQKAVSRLNDADVAGHGKLQTDD